MYVPFITDDSQLFKSMYPHSVASQLSTECDVEHFIDAISRWMFDNHLKLNGNKTKLIIVGKKSKFKKVTYNSINVGGSQTIVSTPHAKN